VIGSCLNPCLHVFVLPFTDMDRCSRGEYVERVRRVKKGKDILSIWLVLRLKKKIN